MTTDVVTEVATATTEANGGAEAAEAVEGEAGAKPGPTAEEIAAERKADLERLDKEGQKWRQKKVERVQREQLRQTQARQAAELEAARRELAFARQNPIDYLERNGATADQIAQRIIKRGSLDGQLEEVRSENAAIRQQLEEERKRREGQVYAETRAQAEDQLAKLVSDKEDDYPALSVLPRKELVQKAHALAEDMMARAQRRGTVGIRITTEDLLRELEKNEAPRFTRYQERQAKRADRSKEESAETSAAKTTSGSASRDDTRGNAPRTLSNAQASERGSKPVEFDRLPAEERKQRLVEMFLAGKKAS